MRPQHYNYIMAGGGLAGLSLACHLASSPLGNASILIIDPEAGEPANRTWCYWSNRPGLFDAVAARSWHRLRVSAPGCDRNIDLGGYCYRMVRGSDFYRYARQRLERAPSVTWVKDNVAAIEDDGVEARVVTAGRSFSADWVFDSRPLPRTAHSGLSMRFRGWEIEAPRAAFDPGTVSFLDFRTPPHNDVRFFYLLPLSERRALVEYTGFTAERLTPGESEAALRAYLAQAWRVSDFNLLREEAGIMPLAAARHARRLGPHTMSIGVRGGRLKPTTGFAFRRIQDDSAAIVRSLLTRSVPWLAPSSPGRYRLYDRLMLAVMKQHGSKIPEIFGCLFARNPIERVLAFLDEEASPWQDLALIATLPPGRFLREIVKLALPV